MKWFRRRRRPPRTWLTTTDPLEIVNHRRLIRRFKERERFEASHQPKLAEIWHLTIDHNAVVEIGFEDRR